MSVSLTCACGAAYALKDEFAGAEVRCPKCGAVARAPAQVAPAAQADAAFDRDKFLFRQKVLSINEKYDIRDEEDRSILFIERPARVLRNLLAGLAAAVVVIGGIGAAIAVAFAGSGGGSGPTAVRMILGGLVVVAAIVGGIVLGTWLAPFRHIAVWRDEGRGEVLLRIRQLNKIPLPRMHYSIETGDGRTFAHLSKNHLFDIFRKRWDVADASGRAVCVVKEDSVILSLLRRVLGPLYGLLRTNFVFLDGDGSGERVLGEFNRKFTLLDRYVLDLSGDRDRTLDRRIAVAMGVLLDTAEKR